MWIQTQNKQRIINSDQIIDIFIGRTGTKIVANTTCYDLDASEVVLGEYQDRDTCMTILEHMSIIIGITGKIPGITIPLGGEVEEWCKFMEDLGQAFVIRDLLK